MTTGRPSIFSDELVDRICEELACGKSLLKICAEEWAPGYTTIFRWLDFSEDFRNKYARAREAQAEYYAQEIIELADTCREGKKTRETKDGTFTETGDMVERSRLQIEARKWYASKVAPKKFGDKVTQEHTGDGGGPIVFKVERVGK